MVVLLLYCNSKGWRLSSLPSARPSWYTIAKLWRVCIYRYVRYTPFFLSFSLPLALCTSGPYLFFFYRDQRNDDSTQLFRNVLLSFSNVIRWKVTTDRGGPNWRREKETRPLWLRGENSILLVNNKTIRWTWVILLFTENRVPVLPRYFIYFFFFISQ